MTLRKDNVLSFLLYSGDVEEIFHTNKTTEKNVGLKKWFLVIEIQIFNPLK